MTLPRDISCINLMLDFSEVPDEGRNPRDKADIQLARINEAIKNLPGHPKIQYDDCNFVADDDICIDGYSESDNRMRSDEDDDDA